MAEGEAEAKRLREMDLDELVEEAIAQHSGSPGRRAGFELERRLIAALTEFKRSSDRAAAALVFLTIVLVVLTGVIVWLTAELE